MPFEGASAREVVDLIFNKRKTPQNWVEDNPEKFPYDPENFQDFRNWSKETQDLILDCWKAPEERPMALELQIRLIDLMFLYLRRKISTADIKFLQAESGKEILKEMEYVRSICSSPSPRGREYEFNVILALLYQKTSSYEQFIDLHRRVFKSHPNDEVSVMLAEMLMSDEHLMPISAHNKNKWKLILLALRGNTHPQGVTFFNLCYQGLDSNAEKLLVSSNLKTLPSDEKIKQLFCKTENTQEINLDKIYDELLEKLDHACKNYSDQESVSVTPSAFFQPEKPGIDESPKSTKREGTPTL